MSLLSDRHRSFPPDFIWGSATASYQIEGAVTEDGRGPSIWDTFSHTPGKVTDGDTGDVADDHYHRYVEDLDHMAGLGLDAYRFSIAWPRVQPGGIGALNPKGVDFYARLVDGLLERGIRPVATLYHWDLPQELEDAGGWPVRDTALRFADYTSAIIGALGDRVHTWTTFNEPYCAAYLGYASGVHAPGRTSGADALAAVHHLNLAHGLAGRIVRDLAPSAELSVTLNLAVIRAATDSAEDAAAVRKLDNIANGAFLGPMLEGKYPADLLTQTAHVTDWSFVQDGDEAAAHVPLDVLGINYYSTILASHWDGTGERQQADGHGDSAASPWVGVDDVNFLVQPGPYTEMGWNIEPQGMTDLLLRISHEYPEQPMMITENGAAFADEVVCGRPGPRSAAGWTTCTGTSMPSGSRWRPAPTSGATSCGRCWTTSSGRYGYSKRFGIIRVDYDTAKRTLKDSALWYRRLIETDQLPDVATAAE